jgi:hypothetical protein
LAWEPKPAYADAARAKQEPRPKATKASRAMAGEAASVKLELPQAWVQRAVSGAAASAGAVVGGGGPKGTGVDAAKARALDAVAKGGAEGGRPGARKRKKQAKK